MAPQALYPWLGLAWLELLAWARLQPNYSAKGVKAHAIVVVLLLHMPTHAPCVLWFRRHSPAPAAYLPGLACQVLRFTAPPEDGAGSPGLALVYLDCPSLEERYTFE